ncbi:hypothetical protein EV182_004016 [Spiromyces aspiralis]|uniref:Uncharacterized protein n=1 Tax=Spiromyces aspiralis TaxID=68401 RepID=A0ACC1HVR9_9FUNG|nr:hypothetical protein EV182_004016 [Spiromyces aspiralis]
MRSIQDIYDSEVRVFPPEESRAILAEYIATSRRYACEAFSAVKNKGQEYVDQWIAVEKRTAAIVKDTIPKDEVFMPNALYVLLAGLAGPIFARKPAAYFMPGTTGRAVTKIWTQYGDPETLEAIKGSWETVKESQILAQQKLAQKIRELRQSIEQANTDTTKKSNPPERVIKPKVADTVEGLARNTTKGSETANTDTIPSASLVSDAREIVQEKQQQIANTAQDVKAGINTIYETLGKHDN